MQGLDYLCVAFFTLEIIVRFAFAPNKKKFWKGALNVIDLVCLVPHYAAIIMKSVDSGNDGAVTFLKTLMLFRVVRILRIFKLMKHYSAFKILVYTIKVSTKELFLMVVFLMSGVLMFASIIHYAEQDNFPNIPIAIWWALVTMTTVGYGDKYPVGYIGYGVGCLSVICGVLVIAFTVPIVVNNFSLYYAHAKTRIKLPNRKLKKRLKDSSLTSMNSRTQTRSTLLSAEGLSDLQAQPISQRSNHDAGKPPDRRVPKHNSRIGHGQDTVLEDLESADSQAQVKYFTVSPILNSSR